MTQRIENATQAEKAKAWERLMASTGKIEDAVLSVWEWLDTVVEMREEKEI